MGIRVKNLCVRALYIMVSLFPFFLMLIFSLQNFAYIDGYKKELVLFPLILPVLCAGSLWLLFHYRKKIFSRKYQMMLILLICLTGVLLRIFYICIFKTVPVSDFNTVYSFSLGCNNPQLVDYVGQFSYLFYQGKLMRMIFSIFGGSVFIGQMFNCFLAVITMFFLFLTGKTLFHSTTLGLIPSLLFGIDPSMGIYCCVLSGEHIAIMFLSMFLSCLVYSLSLRYNKKSIVKLLLWFSLDGLLLALFNIFKPVGFLILIAIIVANIVIVVLPMMTKRSLEINKYNKFSRAAATIAVLLLSFSVLNQITNNYYTHVTGNQMKFSVATIVYEGLVFEGGGSWNPNVKTTVAQVKATYEGDPKKADSVLWEMLKSDFNKNYRGYPDMLKYKLRRSWDPGYAYIDWAVMSAPNGSVCKQNQSFIRAMATNFSCWYYLMISTFSIIGSLIVVFKPQKNRAFIFVLNIAVFGMALIFLLMEAQGRYKSIFHPIFLMISSMGIVRAGLFLSKNKYFIGNKNLNRK
jgi:hypothetical protein